MVIRCIQWVRSQPSGGCRRRCVRCVDGHQHPVPGRFRDRAAVVGSADRFAGGDALNFEPSPAKFAVGWTVRESRDSQTWTDPPGVTAPMAPASVDVGDEPTERRGAAEKSS